MDENELIENFCKHWEDLIPYCKHCKWWSHTHGDWGYCSSLHYISKEKMQTKKEHGCYEFKNN